MLIVGLPAGPDRTDEHRRPVARDGRRSRGGAAVKRLLLLAVLLAAAAFSGGVGRSQATFVANSEPRLPVFAASAAFNAVAVALSDPGTPLRSTVAAVGDRDLRPPAHVGHLRALAGRRRHLDDDLHPDRRAPYTCSWNSAGVADGLYDLRATALDASGYASTSGVASRRVDNTAPATSVSAATPLTGTATVSATATDGGSGVLSVAFDARRPPAAAGRRSAPTAARPTRAAGTRRPSPTAPGTSAPPPPTTRATPRARPRPTASSTTPTRP